MKLRPVLLAVPMLFTLGQARTARADINVVHTDTTALNIGGMAQGLALAQSVDDPYQSNERLYLFLKEARLRFTGETHGVRFRLELGMGGEDVVSTSTGVALGLLDLSFEIPLLQSKTTFLKVGQFKVPYGREQLEYTGDSSFSARSIENVGFVVGRDVGGALVLHPGLVTVIGGVFTGGGRDIPVRNLPQKLGFPMVVLRAGVGNLDSDPFQLSRPLPADHTRGALFVGGLFTRDSEVGHSTVLNVKLADKSVLLNTSWNPYLARQPFAQGDWWQVGADAAVRSPLGKYVLAGEVEGNWAGYQNTYGVLHIAGARAQAGVSRGPVSLTVRYAFLVPDAHFVSNGVPVTGAAPMHELTPALCWRAIGDNVKLIADFPLLLNVPVFTENGVGSYVGTDLPAEASVLGPKGSEGRQNVLQARLFLQAQF